MFVSRTRSILKTISWRVVGTLDTIALGWFIMAWKIYWFWSWNGNLRYNGKLLF